jgi:O-acetyl-ADP-ribose deacetylase
MVHQLELTTLSVLQGDITQQEVDAIVNAANSALCGGGGVDGAIHRVGGATILAECRTHKGGCPTGQAVATTAGNLKAKQVIHAVGPVWRGGTGEEREELANAYRNSLKLAAANGHRTIAFPSLSTGAYRFPIKTASRIAWETILEYCRDHPKAFDEVRLVTFSDKDRKVYCKALEDMS